MRKNCMAEVAKLLGVELGEEFHVEGFATNVLYKISEKGLVSHRCGSEWLESESFMLSQLLAGEEEITRLPWKPKYSEHYYIPVIFDGNNENNYAEKVWYDTDKSKQQYIKRLVCKTKEEAIELARRMLAVAKEERENG